MGHKGTSNSHRRRTMEKSTITEIPINPVNSALLETRKKRDNLVLQYARTENTQEIGQQIVDLHRPDPNIHPLYTPHDNFHDHLTKSILIVLFDTFLEFKWVFTPIKTWKNKNNFPSKDFKALFTKVTYNDDPSLSFTKSIKVQS